MKVVRRPDPCRAWLRCRAMRPARRESQAYYAPHPWRAVNREDRIIEHARIAANGIELHVEVAGPPDGALIVLLHGFPELGMAWQPVMESLASRGWRVWAPDLRGYGASDRPRGIAAYTTELLAADVRALIDAAGVERAVVVGHDWGGVVAWEVARRHAERVSKLVILNAPHPAAMRHRLRSDPRQLLRSWYVIAFQIPWLPERLMRLGGCRALVRALRRSSRAGTFSPALLRDYRLAWSQPGALTAMIAYYRAARLRPRERAPRGPLSIPTLILWGVEDAFLVTGLAADSAEHCLDARVELVSGATHWLHHEEPARVSDAMARFLADADG